MSSVDRLYDLLPAVHRGRDLERGGPLRDLLRVVAEQVQVVEDDIAQLYDNMFIETADEWAVAYLADLIGYRPVPGVGLTGPIVSQRDMARHAALLPRRDVANTLRHRRRKGTLALLEELAGDVSSWPARAVEFFRLLAWTQALNHQRPSQGRAVDVRDVDALDRLGGPFEEAAHTVDVRRITSHRTPGWYNLPEIGLFVWRLRPYSVTRSTANRAEQAGRHCFTFSILGNDAPLFIRPDPEPDRDHIADEHNVPAPIRRLVFEAEHPTSSLTPPQASPVYYGEGRSLAVYAPGWPTAQSPQPIPAAQIVPADLSGWRYRMRTATNVAVDPVLGRIMFPPNRPPKSVDVTYHYGFSADLGGGEYERPIPTLSMRALATFRPDDLTDDVGSLLARLQSGAGVLERDLLARWSAANRDLLDAWNGAPTVPPELLDALRHELELLLADESLYSAERFPMAPPELIAVALDQPQGDRLARVNRLLLENAFPSAIRAAFWKAEAGTDAELAAALDQWRAATPRRAVIELTRSDVYSTSIDVTLAARQELTIRAANRARPVIWLADREAGQPDSLSISLGEGSRASLDGLLVTGRAVHFEAAATVVEDADTTGDHTCVGTRRVVVRHCTFVPGWTLHYDCEPHSPEEPGIELLGLGGATVVVDHSIVGPIDILAAEDGLEPVTIEIRDSIVDATRPDSLAVRSTGGGIAAAVLRVERCTVIGRIQIHAIDLGENTIFLGLVTVARRQRGCIRFCYVPPLSRTPVRFHCQPDLVEDAVKLLTAAAAQEAAIESERARVRPRFTSLRYGRAAYCQLAGTCAAEIARGADDESEMGVYHDLYQPQRSTALQARLEEYTPAGTDASIVFVT